MQPAEAVRAGFLDASKKHSTVALPIRLYPVTEDAQNQDDMVDRACRIAFKEGFAKPGQRVIVVAGVPLGTPGATNMLRIAYVGADDSGD